MTIKNDKWIRESGILTPCSEFTNIKQESGKDVNCISYGISSYGYDLRCSKNFKVCNNNNYSNEQIIDPYNFYEGNFLNYYVDECVIPPNSFALTKSIEYIKMPRNVVGFCVGKSTYARCGVVANTTLIEPEWEGYLVIELSNTTPRPVKIYANEGIVQLIFLEANDLCQISYKDRKGKYQNQTGIQIAKV